MSDAYRNELIDAVCSDSEESALACLRRHGPLNEESLAQASLLAAFTGRPSRWIRNLAECHRFATFTETMNAASRGDDQAVWELIERFAPHVERVIRRRLDGRLRSKFDVEDFVQMVWVSFFREPEQLRRFHSPDHVRRFLALMARNKVLDENRRRLDTQKYDVGREISMGSSEEEPAPEVNADTPSQVAMARECWTRIMDAESERNRKIVRLRLSGWNYVEIAKEIGISERAIRKVLAKIFRKSGFDDRHAVA